MKKLYVNPLAVRVWHWFNALCFIVLILTGLQIRYIGQINLLMTFRTAVQIHNIAGFSLAGALVFWFCYHLFTDKVKVFQSEPTRAQFFDLAVKQLKFYSWGLMQGDPNPQHVTPLHKFNPLQSMTYQIVLMILLPIQLATGIVLWKVKLFTPIVDLLGGVRVVDTIHVVLFIFFTAFVLMHAYMGSLGVKPMTHFKEMWTGYEEIEEPGDAKTKA